MEELKALDFSNMLRESYFTDDCPCAHHNCEHTLIYLCSGKLEIEQEGRRTVLHEGECAFMRRDSLYLLPANRPDIRSLFESVLRLFEAEVKPSEEQLRRKMVEGLYVLLNTDKNLYASLFDFTAPWKIDLMDFMEQNYMNDLSLEEMASYTGRSLSTFKRDFQKYSELTPQRWITQRRLEAACELLRTSRQKVSEVCWKVGFKNLSQCSKIYKER